MGLHKFLSYMCLYPISLTHKYLQTLYVVLLQSLGSASTPGAGVASVSEETQELLARVAELQQEKWNLEEKVWRAKERWRGREGVWKSERERERVKAE